MRVLIADDNHEAADTLAMVFELEGYRVRTEYSGTSALDAFKTFHPDIACLDIEMPGLTGCEVARKIRKLDGDHRVLLVAISGLGATRDKVKALAAGFDRYVVKPPDLDQLRMTLDDWHRGTSPL